MTSANTPETKNEKQGEKHPLARARKMAKNQAHQHLAGVAQLAEQPICNRLPCVACSAVSRAFYDSQIEKPVHRGSMGYVPTAKQE
jgi:hypothetical protein